MKNFKLEDNYILENFFQLLLIEEKLYNLLLVMDFYLLLSLKIMKIIIIVIILKILHQLITKDFKMLKEKYLQLLLYLKSQELREIIH